MAPVRKTKGVNKRFPYINEVASNKYGDNANKNKQKKRKLSDMLGPQWTTEELKHFYEGYRKYGKDWMKVASVVRHRSLENVEALYTMNRAYLSLPEGAASVIGLTAMMCDYYSMLERSDSEQNCIDNAGTPRKPQKLARGKLRNDASKGLEGHILDISQSRSIASDGCLSLLKNRRTDEDSSFDALLTLADLSLRMPEATAEMESSALVEEENFNIAKKSKLKRNPSVTMVEDTALKTSQLGKLKEGVQQSDTGIQKRKQKSPVKVVTVLTLESQIRDLQAQLATTRARFAHEEAQQEQSLAALEVLSQNLAQAREAAQQAEHAAVQAGFHLDDHLLRLSYVARRL